MRLFLAPGGSLAGANADTHRAGNVKQHIALLIHTREATLKANARADFLRIILPSATLGEGGCWFLYCNLRAVRTVQQERAIETADSQLAIHVQPLSASQRFPNPSRNLKYLRRHGLALQCAALPIVDVVQYIQSKALDCHEVESVQRKGPLQYHDSGIVWQGGKRQLRLCNYVILFALGAWLHLL